jgi:hypothetical protein
MDKPFTIVGVSTQGKITKFRFANGDMAQRIKVLERNGHSDINLITLPEAMGKMAAIEAYTAQFPEAANIRVPNEKEAKPAKEVKAKTVTIKKGAGKSKTVDAAAELLKAVEEA